MALTREEKEEIAEEWQAELQTSVGTGTTLTPGLIAPVGTPLSGGRTKISWPEVAGKIAEELGLEKGDVLPSVPGEVSAQAFYRAGAKLGFTPGGAATFQQSPFGTFAGRMDVAAGQAPAATQEAIESAAEGQQQVISGFRRPLEAIDTGEERFEGAGSMAMTGDFGLLALLGGVSGAIGSILQGTPFHDFGHMLGRDSGGTAHNTQGFNREYTDMFGQTTTVNMNETLWRQWDNLDKGQQELLALGVQKMYKDEDGNWRETTGERREKTGEAKENIIKQGDPGWKDIPWVNRLFGWGRTSKWQMTPGKRAEEKVFMDLHQPLYDAQQRLVSDYFGDPEDYYYATEKQKMEGTSRHIQMSYGDWDYAGGEEGYVAASQKEKGPSWKDTESQSLAHLTDYRPPEEGGPEAATSAKPAKMQAFSDPIDWPGMTLGSVSDKEAAGVGSDWTDYTQIGQGKSGGRVTANLQEGGPIPEMPQPQGGAPGEDVANLGVINEQAVQPQQGGQKSVKDDVPRKADEGDYILPYETVLMVGLKQLNRYAREAIKLAMKNDINLAGTDLDPTDDVPIKVSNYEYHIPKTLVPFFGGGKKYLDKIREEGLALRKRLEEEKQPSAQEQQAQPAPPQMAPPQAGPPQAGPPQMPMMRKGGFVPDPNEGQQQQTPTTAAVLEGDTSQQATAYNQLRALQRSKKTQQQPPMVDPTGKVIPQGFAAPQGYDAGGTIFDSENPPTPQEKPELEERGYFKTAQKRMEMFHRLEPAQKLAMVAMLEGRGEGRQGMQAIMNVVMNRVNTGSNEFIDTNIPGTSLEQVLMKPLAFTALSALNKNHPYNNPKSSQYSPDKYSREVDNLSGSFDKIREQDKNWKEALEDARKAMAGKLDDITKGALFYYNPEKQGMPRHLRDKSFLTAVGKHHFHNSGGFVNKVLDTAA